MREILFRGKRADTIVQKEWLYGYYSVFDGKHAIMPDDGLWRKAIPETVGQFTGLLDKQGKKIFEGDNVKHVDFPITAKVEFTENGKWMLYYETGRYVLLADRIEYIEVIGNIHDTETPQQK